jgi:hypothetical protein
MFAPSYAPKLPLYASETYFKLPEQVGVLSLATAFRETALDFMNQSEQWGKAELAMWLMGPYSHCTRHSLSAREPAIDAPMLLREIDARFVDRVIGSARTSVLDVFSAELAAKNIGSFAYEMVEAGFVTRCQDSRGHEGWLPTTAPRRLSERILSLFAADYLTRPPAFEGELSVCQACRIVEFDVTAHRRGICHRHQSGFFGLAGNRPAHSRFPEGA